MAIFVNLLILFLNVDGQFSIPIIAMGVLTWIRYNFTDPEYYLTSFNTSCIPIHLELLREICDKHPLQRPHIFALLRDAFELETPLDALTSLEMKRTLLDNIVYLLQSGYALPVLTTVEKWKEKMDQSLLRHFIVETLDSIGPPYSNDFLQPLLTLFFKVKETLKHHEKKQLFIDLLEYCSDEPRCLAALQEFK